MNPANATSNMKPKVGGILVGSIPNYVVTRNGDQVIDRTGDQVILGYRSNGTTRLGYDPHRVRAPRLLAG